MISILIAAGVALAVVLLGTPVAIHAFSTWGWGQRIREDGPHTHLEKMGTPTMGGIVILIGFVLGYLASRVTTQRFTATGLALVLGAVGFGVVGIPRRLREGEAPPLARPHEGAEVPRDGDRVVAVRLARHPLRG